MQPYLMRKIQAKRNVPIVFKNNVMDLTERHTVWLAKEEIQDTDQSEKQVIIYGMFALHVD